MLSVLDGLLLEVTATGPAAFDTGPESISVTVMVKVAPTPTGVLAVSGLIVVEVVRAVTVKLAAAVLPVPPLVEVTAPVVLLFTPVEVPFTFTENVQEVLDARVAPDRLTELVFCAAVIVPPPHVPVRPFGVATSRPAGSASVKPAPVSATVFEAGLVMVKLRLVLSFTGIEAAPNDLPMVGGPTTAKVIGLPVPEASAPVEAVAEAVMVTGPP
jgi:hypothetical protein